MNPQPVISSSSPESVPAPVVARPRAAAGAPEAMRSSLPNDPAFMPIIAEFVTDLRRKLTLMEIAASGSEFAELKRLGHWLKGTGPTLGFVSLGDAGGELETHAQAANRSGALELLARLQSAAAAIEVPALSGPESRT